MKKLISILVLMCMTVGLLAVMPVGVSATDEVAVTADNADIVINSVEDWMEKLSGKTVGEQTVFVNAAVLDFDGVEVAPIVDFKGHFNGNGVIIKNMNMVTDNETGIFLCITGDVIIENIVIEDSYFEGYEWVGSIVCCIGAESNGVIIRNIYVGQGVSVVATREGNKGCSGGIIGGAIDIGKVAITDCVFEGTVKGATSSARYLGGIVGNANGKNEVTVLNCLMTGDVIMGNKSYISGIADGNNAEGSIVDYCISIPAAETIIEDSCKYASKLTKGDFNWSQLVNVYGLDAQAANEADECYIGDVFTARENDVMIPNGVAALEALNPEFKVPNSIYYNTIEENVDPEQPTEPEAPAASLAGEGTEASPYLIANAQDWLIFIELSENKSFAGEFVRLEADLDFTNVTVTPIEGFAGTLDGNGKTVRNITMKGSGDVALFCSIGDNATIKNMVISASTFEIEGDGNWIGTLACCTNGKNVTIKNIYVDKDVTITATKKDGNSLAGGILGGVYGNVQSSVTIDSCVFAGTVTGTGDNVAGILASVEQKKAFDANVEFNTVLVKNCLNVGTVKSDGSMVSGIAVGQGITVENCINAGKVSGKNTVAGVLATNPYSAVVVKNCYSVDSIVAYGSRGNSLITEEDNTADVALVSFIGAEAVVELEGWEIREADVAIPAGVAAFAPTWYVEGQTYTVTWIVGSVQVEVDQCVLGEIPTYDGETPSRPSNQIFSYVFVGWTPEITPVSGNVTYTAQFEMVENEIPEDEGNGEGDGDETEADTEADTEEESTPSTVVEEEKSFFEKIIEAIISFFENIIATIFGKKE